MDPLKLSKLNVKHFVLMLIIPFSSCFNDLPWNFPNEFSIVTPKLEEERTHLTFRVTVLCPDSWEYPSLWFWADENGPFQALYPMTKLGTDTWEFVVSYNNDVNGYTGSNVDFGVIQANENVHVRIWATDSDDMHNPMLGNGFKIKFPISEASNYFPNSPEFIMTPYFDNKYGMTNAFNVSHPLLGERTISMYIPPGRINPYKNFPVTIAIDMSPIYMNLMSDLLDSWFVSDIEETVLIGFGDWNMQDGGVDRINLLTPVVGDSFSTCKEGTADNFCNGCFPNDTLPTIEDEVRCLNTIKAGGGSDLLLDWLLDDILLQAYLMFPDRLLTSRENVAVIGYSLGGLFSCNAAWKMHQYIGKAACQSSSFWWPTNVENVENEFQFVEALDDPELSSNRLPQKIVIDVGGAEEEGDDDDFKMVTAGKMVAHKLMELPYFEKDKNIWFQVYPGKSHSLKSWFQRIWNPLKMLWN